MGRNYAALAGLAFEDTIPDRTIRSPACKEAISPSKPFRLLDLPAEIVLAILQEYFKSFEIAPVNFYPQGIYYQAPRTIITGLDILRTSRWIYTNALPYLRDRLYADVTLLKHKLEEARVLPGSCCPYHGNFGLLHNSIDVFLRHYNKQIDLDFKLWFWEIQHRNVLIKLKRRTFLGLELPSMMYHDFVYAKKYGRTRGAWRILTSK